MADLRLTVGSHLNTEFQIVSHLVNQVNSHNGYSHDDNTVNINKHYCIIINISNESKVLNNLYMLATTILTSNEYVVLTNVNDFAFLVKLSLHDEIPIIVIHMLHCMSLSTVTTVTVILT